MYPKCLRRVVPISIISFLALLSTSQSQAQDQGIPDTVLVATAIGSIGNKVILNVSGFNDQPLGALQVPLKFPHPDLTADSISFTGTRLATASLQPVYIDSANQTLTFGAVYFAGNLAPGSGLLAKIHFSISPTATEDTVVIDTLLDPPNALTFSDTSGALDWTPVFQSGNIILTEANSPPVWEPAGNHTVLEGNGITLNLKASDPDDGLALTLAGSNLPPGSNFTDNGNGAGTFSWTPPFVGPGSSAGSPFAVTFTVSDGIVHTDQTVLITVINNNRPPILIMPGSQTVDAQELLNFQVSAVDPDREGVLLSSTLLPIGAAFGTGNPGSFNWSPTTTQVGQHFAVFKAEDQSGGLDIDTVEILVNYSLYGYSLSVSNINAYAGENVLLTVGLDNVDSVAGFSLLLHYDHTALILKSVSRSNARTMDWEFFSYQLNPNNIPGDISFAALADIPNPKYVPPLLPGSGPIVELGFQILDDELLGGLSLPIVFVLNSPSNNTLSKPNGSLIPQDSINYKDGSVYVELISILPGDVNVNGLPFEIGDAVTFANHLTSPSDYPFTHLQSANSDCNLDGYRESVADLIFMLNRILQGGPAAAFLSAETESQPVDIWIDKESHRSTFGVTTTQDLGGMLFSITHDPDATLVPEFTGISSAFETRYDDKNGELRVLIYSPEGNVILPGQTELFKLNSKDVSIQKVEVSSADGQILENVITTGQSNSTHLPKSAELYQNFPNPFNLETTIAFYLAGQQNVELKVYNLRGQKVRELCQDNLTAGFHQIRWDGLNQSGEEVASGIYFYKLEAGGKSLTRKLTLLK